jgi:hypothetical protein
MSLRTALAALPDDRGTVHVAREVVACFAAHPREPFGVDRIARATGLDAGRVEPVIRCLTAEVVLDCDGDPRLHPCVFDPGPVLQLEVERFLRSASPDAARMHTSIGRFRSRYGRD